MNISLYCNSFKNMIPKKTEYNQKNLMLGSIDYEPIYKSKLFRQGFIFDDTGDNISYLNKKFGQLTGLYWVWKNTNEDIIGTNTYRLYWGDYFLKNDFKSNTLYVPSLLNVNECFKDFELKNSNIYDQYSYCHGEINLKFLKKLSIKNQIPVKDFMIDNLKNEHFLYPFNMFISERKIFNSVCETLFNILFTYNNVYYDNLNEIENLTNQNRILDFLSERILHIIYTNLNYFLPDVKLISIPIINLNH